MSSDLGLSDNGGDGVASVANGLVLRFMPNFVLDIANSLHFYEAVLAALAILIWHFYFVIFDLDVYHMDTAWLVRRSLRAEHRSPSAEQEPEQ